MEVTRALVVDGEVEHPFTTHDPDGGVGRLLERAGPSEGADHALVHASDGVFRMSIPLAALRGAALVDGRLVVPGAPSKQWNVKDVARIEVTTGPRPDSWQEGMDC